MTWKPGATALALLLLSATAARAQGNYEVQVYGSELAPPGRTMVELHSNFTFEGSKTPVDGVRPDEHALHETLEVTQGFTRGSSWAITCSQAIARRRASSG